MFMNYAQYLLAKCNGDIAFAMKIQRTKCELSLNNPDRFATDVEVYQCLEVLNASK